MYFVSAWKVIYASRQRNCPSVRVVATNPFFAPWLALQTSPRRVTVISLVYDLFPDAFEVAGLLRANSLASMLLALPTRLAFKRASATVFLGTKVKSHAESRYGPAANSRIIPVGADGSCFAGYPPRCLRSGEQVILLYCGQMGKMHDVETLARFIKRRLPGSLQSKLVWLFHAYGAGFQQLRDAVGSNGAGWEIKWRNPLSEEDWIAAMKNCHVGVVTMGTGAEKVVMPSKTYSAMVAGQAILAICPRWSDLADTVRKHDCGWVVEPGDVEGLGAILSEIGENSEVLHEKRLNSFAAGHRYYDVKTIASQWIELFEELVLKTN
jgi:glycosyltransferase involved in cell wall biosynthesis